MPHRASGASRARCYHAFVMSAATPRGIAMSPPLLAALGLAGCLFAAAASAQLYRWVDKDGKVLGSYSSKVAPESPELRGAIDQALA